MNPDIHELDELEFDPYLSLYNCCKLESFVAVRRRLGGRTPDEQRKSSVAKNNCRPYQALWKTQFVTTILVYSEQ